MGPPQTSAHVFMTNFLLGFSKENSRGGLKVHKKYGVRPLQVQKAESTALGRGWGGSRIRGAGHMGIDNFFIS